MKRLYGICYILLSLLLLTSCTGEQADNTQSMSSKLPPEFTSFEEFHDAILNPEALKKDEQNPNAYRVDDMDEVTEYYVPAEIPPDYEIRFIKATNGAVILTYYPKDPDRFVAEEAFLLKWRRAVNSYEKYDFVEEMNDRIAHSSADHEFYEGYFIEKLYADGKISSLNIYQVFFQTEDGRAFFAKTPQTWSYDEIVKYCQPKLVTVKEK